MKKKKLKVRANKRAPKRAKQRSPEERKAKREHEERAAREEAASEEMCLDLAGRFGCQSKRKMGDARGAGYSLIGAELATIRDQKGSHFSLVMWPDYETDEALANLLSRLDGFIHKYVLSCIASDQQNHRWKIRECVVSDDLMVRLAIEYVRDRETLFIFLGAVFKRWRTIFAPSSIHRVRVVVQAIAARYKNDRSDILAYLQRMGLAPDDKHLSPENEKAWRWNIGQYVSRDPRKSASKNIPGFRHRVTTAR